MPHQNSRTSPADSAVDHFVYSPASSYPTPYARLIDRRGREVHTWSHTAAQPAISDDPPSFLRGWNHVEVDQDGCLFAMVPLRALLKLAPDSTLLWQADVTAHHDLALLPGGGVLVLAEVPRRITWEGLAATVLDNTLAELDAGGRPVGEISLFDVLATEPALATVIRRQILVKQAAFAREGEALTGDVSYLFATGTTSGPVTRALRLLRQLPGSPCDLLHTNTIEILAEHPAGLWPAGAVLVSMRNLDLIAVIDPGTPRVLWWWGPGEVSGQHQPSMLPSGHLLVFDNGRAVGRSRVLELDPAARRVVWQYGTRPGEQFFTELAGGCERLPNGNTLVSEAEAGRAFEITPHHRIAWRWRTRKEPDATGTSRVTFYRLAGVPNTTAAKLLQTRPAPAGDVGDHAAPPGARPCRHHRPQRKREVGAAVALCPPGRGRPPAAAGVAGGDHRRCRVAGLQHGVEDGIGPLGQARQHGQHFRRLLGVGDGAGEPAQLDGQAVERFGQRSARVGVGAADRTFGQGGVQRGGSDDPGGRQALVCRALADRRERGGGQAHGLLRGAGSRCHNRSGTSRCDSSAPTKSNHAASPPQHHVRHGLDVRQPPVSRRSRSAATISRASSASVMSNASGALSAVSETRANSAKSWFLRARISMMRWSTPSSESRRCTCTDSSCPILWERPMACHSVVGLSWGSQITTTEAD